MITNILLGAILLVLICIAFMAKCVDYEGGITFPYNRVNKFRTYLKVKLRKDHGFKER